ncbi:MAG: SUMF1/EgtB/PvdO family nonheme iron enzyme [Halobacteriovoraceae bacterium]|nr:SUMF1/EgtB/PvdO family nonheme iron enzyme [Halobacteriovoraceae bacterium]
MGETYSSNVMTYETVKVPPGSFILSVPINNSISTTFIDKRIHFKKSFYIGKYEVSNKLWDECYKANYCHKKSVRKLNESDNHPVVRINWHDAHQFTRWYSKITKMNYRLPTEEEWAYSMNLGKDYKESEIDYDYKALDLHKLPLKVTRPLGTISKNDWGIYDFKGNVWEWTLTCWYSSKKNILKKRSVDELNNSSACTTRIAQGENRSHIPDFIFNTYNGGCSTLRPAANLGFRMVRED